jgi:hypothetical protein
LVQKSTIISWSWRREAMARRTAADLSSSTTWDFSSWRSLALLIARVGKSSRRVSSRSPSSMFSG